MLLILCLIIAGVTASWSSPVKVDECKTKLKQARLYLDQSSKTAHIFWCELNSKNGRFNLLYRRQYSNDVLSPIAVLDTEHACEVLSVTGHHDGEQVNVAYGASRKFSHMGCNKENTDGCLDVYAMDSNDGGFTFSQPTVVKRDNLNDIWNRHLPKILANPLTGRQWIFYVITNVENTKYGIGFVTRPEGAINYSSEIIIMLREELIMEVSVAQSMKKGSHFLHLIWNGEVEGQLRLVHQTSKNNGVSWSEMSILGEGFAGNFYSHIKMDGSLMILPWLQSTTTPSFLRFSHENGQNWKDVKISENTGIPQVEVCYKKGKNDAIAFSMLNADKGKNIFEGQYGAVQIAKNSWVRGQNPFGQMNMAFDPGVGCYVENNHYIVKAVGIENEIHNQKNLYITKTAFDQSTH